MEFCITMLTVLCGTSLQGIFYHSAVAVVLGGVVWRCVRLHGGRGGGAGVCDTTHGVGRLGLLEVNPASTPLL